MKAKNLFIILTILVTSCTTTTISNSPEPFLLSNDKTLLISTADDLIRFKFSEAYDIEDSDNKTLTEGLIYSLDNESVKSEIIYNYTMKSDNERLLEVKSGDQMITIDGFTFSWSISDKSNIWIYPSRI